MCVYVAMTNNVTKRGIIHAILWMRSGLNLSRNYEVMSSLIFYSNRISKANLSFFKLFSHPLFLRSSYLSPCCSFWPSLFSGGQRKVLRQARLSMGHTKLYFGTYRGPERKSANYSSSFCHGGSCCLSPSIYIERVQTGQCAFICLVFPFRVMRPAKVSQVLVM